jgi:hypothetical protein
MATATNPSLLYTSLFVLVAITAAFTLLVVHESNSIADMQETGNPASHNLASLQAEWTELDRKIAISKASLEAAQHALFVADLGLRAHGYLMDGDQVVSGIATTDTKDIDGKPLPDGPWTFTRDNIAIAHKDMASLKDEHDSDQRQKFPKLEDVIRQRQDDQQAVLKRINDQETSLKEDTERLNTQLDTLTKEHDTVDKANKEEVSRRLTRIGQLEDRIRSLLELELHWVHDLQPQGQILEVSPSSPEVVINLGAKDHVFPGLLFQVFQYDRGTYVDKGMIEVIGVDRQIATCHITSVVNPRLFPISKNDFIANPVFSTGEPKVFVVSGEFKQFNKSDIENFIRQTGGVVRDKLGPGIDILVAGDRSEKDQDNAREYQIQAMTEDQLLSFVQHAFPAH